MTSNPNHSQASPKKHVDRIEFLLTKSQYDVMMWTFLERHKITSLKRNEVHLRTLDAMTEIRPHCPLLYCLPLDSDLIPALYADLMIMRVDGIERLILDMQSLTMIRDTQMALDSLIDALEPYYLREIYKDNRNDRKAA